MAVWQCGSVAVWQCGSVAVWQCGSVAVWQCGSVAVWQCGSVAVWQCGSVAVWQCGIVLNVPTLDFLVCGMKILEIINLHYFTGWRVLIYFCIYFKYNFLLSTFTQVDFFGATTSTRVYFFGSTSTFTQVGTKSTCYSPAFIVSTHPSWTLCLQSTMFIV